MTQEFHISATPVGQYHYLLRTELVAPGVPLAEELLHLPVNEWLAIAGYLMDDPLQLVLQGEMNDKNAPNLVELGRELYNTLFQKSLRDSWITAQGIAQNHQQVLRLRLGLKDPSLARLPWEVMHAGDSYGALRYRPLVTGPDITFARYQCGITSVNAYWLRCLQAGQRSPNHLQTHNSPTPAAERGLKVLMVISSPRDLVQLNLLKQEAINLKAELHRQALNLADGGHHQPKIELTVLDQPGREELTQALEQGHYDILHYSGHSNLGSNGGQIYLVSKKTGLTETLSGDDLAGLLINNCVQMVVFNSCFGSYAAKAGVDQVSGEGNLTECLVKRGIRSVLAMSERIPDEVALTLTQLFYRNLSQGYALDLCVSRVRQGLISAYSSQQMYWALPILYLQRDFDGYLIPQVNLSDDVANSQGLSDLLREYQPSEQNGDDHYAAVANNPEILMTDDDILDADLTEETTEVDWLLADSWGDLIAEIEYDDSNYDQDSAMVSDLFRQLDNRTTTREEQSMKAELIQESNKLSEMQVSELEEHLNWGNVPTSITPTSLNIQKRRINPPLSPTPLVTSSNRNRYHKSKSSLLLGLVGASAITIIFGVVWWWYQSLSRQHFLPNIPLPENISSNQLPNINLANSGTGIVTATATALLSQGNLKDGLNAVDELLNRGALTTAETALNLIPVQDTQNPAVNFAWGRLAWLSVQTGNNKYSIDDARRYWARAVQSQPDSILYNNALGFAYYEENNLNYANDAWFKSLNLALQSGQNTGANFEQTKYPQISREPERLTAYAGLALGLYKSAQGQPADKRQKYLQEAIKLRQMVIQNAPADFTIEKLSQNWLWTQQAIADWQSLGQTKLPLL